MTPTRFDIYARMDGRWQRLESLPGDDKDAALVHAFNLDSSGLHKGIRVMAVTEFDSGRAPLETLTWISPHLSKVASVTRQLRDQAEAAGKAVAQRDTGATRAKTKTPSSPMPGQPSPESPTQTTKSRMVRVRKAPSQTDGEALNVAAKLAGNGFVAIAVAAITFVPLTALMRSLGGQMGLDALTQQRLVIGITVLIFVVLAATLMGRVYRQHQAETNERALLPRRMDGDQGRRINRTARRAAPRTRDPIAQPSEKPDEMAVEDLSTEGLVETQDDETLEDAAENVPTADPSGGSLNEGMRRNVLQFLASALSAIKDEVPTMNQHVAFGLNLFGSGGAERYGEHAGLKPMQAFVLVREVIEALGNSPERIDAFCRQYTEYRAQERYRMMIEAGRNAMSRHIEGEADPFRDFPGIVKMWTSDTAARAKSQGIVCIMFTDIVGSTQMTHERGDFAAQEVVRIHNAVVRSALAQHHGREVKHTGDGIMASFTIAANAVRAAMTIQREFALHNAQEGTVPVNVRIGLNAGEAVQEENDFFGTTVQLSARVCDKAGMGEVFLTDNVRALTMGQGLAFEEAGQFEMKGVPQAMALYRVAD